MPHIQLYFDDNIIVCGGAIHKVSLQSTVIGLEYCSSKVNKENSALVCTPAPTVYYTYVCSSIQRVMRCVHLCISEGSVSHTNVFGLCADGQTGYRRRKLVQTHMIVRSNYTIHVHMLTQHNQDIIPDPLS